MDIRTNPPVNRSLSDKAFDHIDHALGRPMFPRHETYRNYFATEAGGSLAGEFDCSPYWGLSGVQGSMAFYHVTEAGLAALAAHLATDWQEQPYLVAFGGHARLISAHSPAKARYAYFLAVREALPDLTFVDFARDVSVRRALA